MTYTTKTVTATETILLESNINSDGLIHAALDLVNLASGDTFVFRVYRKIDGTNYRVTDTITLSGVQSEPDLPIGPAWGNGDMDLKVTAQRTAGVDRVIGVRTMTAF